VTPLGRALVALAAVPVGAVGIAIVGSAFSGDGASVFLARLALRVSFRTLCASIVPCD
jgi:hypothetical protein